MLVVGMLFAVLVLGPLLILAMLAMASNERVAAWLRRATGRQRSAAATAERVLDITSDGAPDMAPMAPDKVSDADANAALGPTHGPA